MPLEKLTQERVERAAPGEFLCDERVTGLMLLCGKRVKTWVAQREVKDLLPDPLTGKYKRKTARVTLGHFPAMSVQEARDRAKDELRRMELGHNPHAARQKDLTVRAAIEQYIAGAHDLRPRTLTGYQYTLDRYLATIADIPLSDLGNKPTIVRNLHAELTKERGKATANGAMRTISAAYNGMLALAMDLPPNPVTRPGVIRWHHLQPRARRIAEDGFPAWGRALQRVDNPIRRAFRLFLLLAGQRNEAARTMLWADVDWHKAKIHYPSPKGGEAAAFDLPISPPVQRVLEFAREFSTAEWAFPGSPWVWPAHSETGHIAESKEPRHQDLLNPHALRRTFISEGYEVAPNKYVSYIANHRVHDSITDEYFQPTVESVRRALTAIDNAILERIGTPLDQLLGPAVLKNGQFEARPPNGPKVE
jgi:hypothetical protein